mmetsp:Transcript_1013/g.3188  ORF Transcript_1013/g.3188 Transcript_1013/m.3188 type:complete len:222 (-) Transcript_1013:287-952(-)
MARGSTALIKDAICQAGRARELGRNLDPRRCMGSPVVRIYDQEPVELHLGAQAEPPHTLATSWLHQLLDFVHQFVHLGVLVIHQINVQLGRQFAFDSAGGPHFGDAAPLLHHDRDHLAAAKMGFVQHTVEFKLAVVVGAVGPLARGLLNILLGDENQNHFGVLDCLGHCLVDVPAHPLLIEPCTNAGRLELPVNLLHSIVVVATKLVLAPVMGEEYIMAHH